MSKLKLKEKPLVLEYGKRYVRRDGGITGRLQTNMVGDPFWDPRNAKSYMENGRYISSFETDEDLVAEYADDIGPQVDRAPFMDQPLPHADDERKAIKVYDGFIKYFPRAIVAVAKLSAKGNEQHDIGDGITPQWDRSKSPDELNSLMRHVIDGQWDAVAWRALANLEKQLENGWEAK